MSLIKKKFLATGAVAKLLNNVFITGRNAANSADVDILKLNASDKAEIAIDLLPSADGSKNLGSGSFRYGSIFANLLKAQDSSTIIDLLNKQLINNSAVAVLEFSGTNAETAVAPTSANHIANKSYVDNALGSYIPSSEKGANNGVAELDAGGKVPVAQLPSSLMSYEGTWNATTNSPTLADGTGNAGDVYIVSVAGTQDLGSGNITFAVGDWVIYNGTIWQKSSNSNAVVSVNSQTGVVVLDSDDIAEGTINKYAKTWSKESITLVAGDITNQYVDLAQTIQASSLDLVVDGVMQTEGVDYTISLTGGAGGVTRLTFAGDLATGGASALVATDILRIKYQY